MAVSEVLGLAVAIEGFRAFQSNMGKMDKSIEKQGKRWSGLSGIAGKAGKLMSGVVKVGLKAVAIGGGLAVGAITGLGAAFFKLASDAAPLEGIGSSFDVLSKKFGVSLDKMKDAASGTIREFDLMKSANVALTGAGDEFGKLFGESLPVLLEAARAAAKATGQDVGFLFESLVNGVKKSSPLLIDNTGLVLKVGEANEQMAASLDITVDMLTAEQKQIALLNATTAAAQTMIKDFGSTQLTAAERMAQFKTTIQNTKDSIGIALVPALNQLVMIISGLAAKAGPALVEWAKTAAQWLSDKLPGAIVATVIWFRNVLIPALTAVWEFIQTNVIPILTTMWRWLQINLPLAIQSLASFWTDTLMPAIATVWEFIQTNILPIFDEVRTWLQINIPLAIETVSAWFTETLIPALATVQEFIIDKVIPALTEAVEWLAINIPLAIEAVSKWFKETLVPTLAAVWEFIKDKVIPILEETVIWLATNIPVAIETLSKFWEETLLPALTTVWQFITDKVIPALTTTVEWLKTNIPKAIEASTKFWKETLQPALKEVWEFIDENLIPILAGIAASILTVLIPALVAWATTMLTVTIPAIASVLIAAAPIILIVAAIGAAIGLLVKAWQEDWLGIRTAITDAWEKHIKPAAEDIVIWFTETLPKAFADFKTAVSERIEETRAAIVGFKDKFVEAGKELIEGIKQGIKDKIASLKRKAVDAIKAALDAIKERFGIESPSKVFAAEIGDRIAEGVAVGIKRSESLVKVAMSDVMDGAKAEARKGLDAISKIFESAGVKAFESAGGKSFASAGGKVFASAEGKIFASLANTLRSTGGGGGGSGGGGIPSTIEMMTVKLMNVEALSFGPLPAGDTTSIANNFNLTTQSLTRPGTLRLEFEAMEMATR